MRVLDTLVAEDARFVSGADDGGDECVFFYAGVGEDGRFLGGEIYDSIVYARDGL
jgi:hypothetical protein